MRCCPGQTAAFAAWLGLAVSCLAGEGVSPGNPPNIILVMADDLGAECLGSYGALDYRTPQLDDLARRGTRFTHCFAQPLCTPSRLQLMTGKYNDRNYIGFGDMRADEYTFGHLLAGAGYSTAIVGKWQLGGGYERPRQIGFDEACLWHIQGRQQRYWQPRIVDNGRLRNDVADRYGPDVLCDYALDFIRRHASRPFFLYYPMCLTHDPFCPTPDSSEPKSEHDPDTRHFRQMVEYMDQIVGRIVRQLDECRIRDNSLLLFTGDNGTHASVVTRTDRGPIRGGKREMTSAGTHVPLIAHWPAGGGSPQVCNDLVDFTDFLPTLADAAGAALPHPGHLDGHSFLPQIRGESGSPRRYVFCYYWGRGRDPHEARVSVRDHRWKLYDDGRFFDLSTDPLEQESLDQNLLSEPAVEAETARRSMQAAIDAFAGR
jgi:arylsulfatase A